MKFLIPVAAICLLAGCASTQPRPANYGTRAPGAAVGTVTDDGWRVVSVTPVGQAPQDVYQTPAPVYSAPVYAPYPGPVIVEPDYYTPPVTFSLGVMLGRGVYFGPRWRHHGRHR